MALEGDVMIPLNTICIVSTQAREHHPVVGITRLVEPIAHIQSDQIADQVSVVDVWPNVNRS